MISPSPGVGSNLTSSRATFLPAKPAPRMRMVLPRAIVSVVGRGWDRCVLCQRASRAAAPKPQKTKFVFFNIGQESWMVRDAGPEGFIVPNIPEMPKAFPGLVKTADGSLRT